MNKKISKVIATFPKDLKFYVTSEDHVISCICNFLGDKVTPVVNVSVFEKNSNNYFFYSPTPITIQYHGNDIVIQSFHYGESSRNVILGAEDIKIILSFLQSFKKHSDIVGYMEFPSSPYNGYEYSKGKNILAGLKFPHLIGIDDKTNAVIKDIDSYFSNIDKHRSMGVNRGINYIFHGPPGTGKTSFARALAHHYNANLFTPSSSDIGTEVSLFLNPSMNNMCIVLVDDFNPGYKIKDYIHSMFDNGAENIIRIFTTNNFANIKDNSFTSRCRRILEFKPPTSDNITTLISRALNVSLEAARPLATLIELKEKQRETAYNIYSETQLAEYKQLHLEQKISKPVIKPFEPLNYRDLNFFLAEYVGLDDALDQASNKLNDWIADRDRYVADSDSPSKESCSIM